MSADLDLGAFDALTFDCYGTLVDWERGILTALRPVLRTHGLDDDDDAILERFGALEAAAEAGTFRPYRAVLAEVLRGFGRELGFEPSPEEISGFAVSVVDWPPFSDSAAALEALAARYRLAVVSNVDDDLFDESRARLGVAFDEVVTAQQVQSYKPARTHFDEVLRRLDLPAERVLHVAQSLYHDIAPARALGFRCVWVNRRSGRPGAGATPPAEAQPDLEIPDMATLAARVADTL